MMKTITNITVHRNGKKDIKYAIKNQAKYRMALVGEMFKEMGVHAARSFVE